MNFFETEVTDLAKEYVRQVLDSGMLSEGKWSEAFELGMKRKFDIDYGFSVNSGTSALHLSLVLANVGKGDEVILPAQTFVATGLAILYVGAKPVFCDIDVNTGNLDVNEVEKLITNKTKAVIFVSWGGHSDGLIELESLCVHKHIKLIHDAAHSLGSTILERPLDKFAEFTCYSFQSIKSLTTSDGGFVCCNNSEDWYRGQKLRWFGIDRKTDISDELGERVYSLEEIGYKYHLNNLSSALGYGNLEGFFFRQAYKNQIALLYREKLFNVSGLELLSYNDDYQSNDWLFTILVEDRKNFIRKMKSNDVPVSVVHRGIDRNTIFGRKNEKLKNQRYWDEYQISIPLHHKLNPDDYWKVIETIQSGW